MLPVLYVRNSTEAMPETKRFELGSGRLVAAVGADLVLAVNEELLAHQLAVALGAVEAIGVVELIVVAGELGRSLDQRLAFGASLGVAPTEAVLAHVVAFLFGEGFARQWPAAVEAREALGVVRLAFVVHQRRLHQGSTARANLRGIHPIQGEYSFLSLQLTKPVRPLEAF